MTLGASREEPPLDTDVAIETPEHIVFRHRVAGPARRFFAYFLDLLLCYFALFVLLFVIVFVALGAAGFGAASKDALEAGAGLWMIALFAAQWLYFVVLEGWKGTTPGKRALGLRVVTTTGRPIGFRAAALRNILRAADSLPVTLAGSVWAVLFGPLVSVTALIAMALTSRSQRLGDLVAGTMVVVPEHAHAAQALVLWPPAQPSEMASMPDDIALDAEERNALELFLRRRARLGRARELELAMVLAGPLSRRFSFRGSDPSRTLALIYDRAANAGRVDAPPSSRGPGSWR